MKITQDFLTLTPAYGRDYKSRTAAVQDFNLGKDFLLQPENLPIGKVDFETGVTVNIRYAKLQNIAVCKVA